MPDALIVTSAFSLMEGRSRREWKLTLETLRMIGVSWRDLLEMPASDAWKWLGWDAAHYREWKSVLDIVHARITPATESGIAVVSNLDDDVPRWLRQLQTVPWVFYLGDLAMLDQPTLGFSGQREAGEQSLTITSSLGTEAARLGFTVVSGGARGIDMAAHTAVLEAGGSTAVILPEGLMKWRPPYALSSSYVLAMSEDVPWERWNSDSAMRRNRMIVNLSDVFTVPQSGISGGSHSTGMYALKRGKLTFVPDLGPNFPGNQKLLQHGAQPLVAAHGRFDLRHMFAASREHDSPSQSPLAKHLP